MTLILRVVAAGGEAAGAGGHQLQLHTPLLLRTGVPQPMFVLALLVKFTCSRSPASLV